MSALRRNTPRFLPAGSPRKGLKPFLTIYSTFLQRAYDMTIHDIAIQKLNVALCMDRAGIERRRWPDASRLVRHRLSASHPELGPHAAEG